MITMLAQATFEAPTVAWWDLSPMLALISGALVLMLAGALTRTWRGGGYALLTSLTAIIGAGLGVWRWHTLDRATASGNFEAGARSMLNGALAFDKLALLLTIAICAAVVLVALLTNGTLDEEGRQTPEPYALFLVASAGAVVMASAADLMVLFLGLETLSLALYVLAASDRRRRRSQEAGFKYFILGGFASAFFLYGIALVYGAAQSTHLGAILSYYTATIPAGGRSIFMLAGIAMMTIGFGFKIAAAPFQFWQPDVYEGSPANVTGFMASVGKIGAFAAIIRVLILALPFQRDDWRPVMWALAAASLVVGAIMAVAQTNVKRMLAYSSINHVGFMLVAVVAAGYTAGERSDLGPGLPALVTYLLLYSVLVIGSFGVVAVVSGAHGGDSNLESFRGLSRRRPLLALMLSVFLLAQAGVPLTSGFIAKFGAISAVVTEGGYALAIIAMVSSVVAAYLYLRIMVSVWFRGGDAEDSDEPVPFTSWLAIGAAAVFTIAVGIYPAPILDIADTVSQYVVG